MKIDNIKYLRAEDFSEEFQQDFAVLAPIINSFMQQVYDLTDERIDFENRVEELVTFTIQVDGSGKIIGNKLFNVGKNIPKGFNVIKAVNSTNYLASVGWT